MQVIHYIAAKPSVSGVGRLYPLFVDLVMEVQSGWKWNEWRKALSVLTILHEERRKREGKERELSYMEVLSHDDASGIQHLGQLILDLSFGFNTFLEHSLTYTWVRVVRR
jgi:hypothetical protein